MRSNAVVLCVDPPGAAPCTSTDNTPPIVESGFGASEPALPGRRLASQGGRSRTILVSWAGQDGAGSGVANYTVEVSEAADGAGASQAEPWRTLLDKAPVQRAALPWRLGRRLPVPHHRDRPRAELGDDRDRPVLIPVDDRDRGLLHALAGLEAHARGERVGPHRRARQRRPARPARCASAARRWR